MRGARGDRARSRCTARRAAREPVAPARARRRRDARRARGTSVSVELARTDAERARGLMDRRELAPDAGMLFLFDETAEHPFWMKNTLIPLDMIFIVGRRPRRRHRRARGAGRSLAALRRRSEPLRARGERRLGGGARRRGRRPGPLRERAEVLIARRCTRSRRGGRSARYFRSSLPATSGPRLSCMSASTTPSNATRSRSSAPHEPDAHPGLLAGRGRVDHLAVQLERLRAARARSGGRGSASRWGASSSS